MTPNLNHTAVVAIDFGTARTGYAFAYTAYPQDIYINKTWPRGPAEAKTLTEVLLTKQHSVVAFGYEARDKFASMNHFERKHYLYFSGFKMTLHNRSGAKRSTVKAVNSDYEICVKKLISLCIGEVKKQALSELSSSSTVSINAINILWVITVPAIWDIPARQAMKEAAELSGLPSDNIEIVLEPEVATVHCMRNQLKINEETLRTYPFMVVDAGGGTVDITVHQSKPDGSLSEVHVPSGGDWGSTYVNQEFSNLLEEIFGAYHLTSMKGTEYWLDVMDSFELLKLKFQDSPNEPAKKNCTIATLGGAPSLGNLTNYAGLGLELINGILRIPSTALRKLFAPVLEKIANHIEYLLSLSECNGIKYLFLVGGFAESPLLRNAIQNKLAKRVIIVTPPRPGTAVLTGAVQYGFNPSIISSRIARRTVGIETSRQWKHADHGRRSIISHNGQKMCSEVFDIFVRIKETINSDQEIRRSYYPVHWHQTEVNLRVCATTKSFAPYTTDPGVTEIGYLKLEVPEPNLHPDSKEINVSIKFGGIVFQVTATYVRTGKTVSAEFRLPLDP